ncbi:hypothetical protein DPM19_07750 [Actinomadura craniellae]|uniref:Polysaccharide biosynthesis protein CapD-like domain-containing protein n=1 Tax=Actinomadura craniellae TaxID=2231787 RepID=A0A365H9I9_9ACTN|nr:polysaccharide biosynthesis protein [Actinomadura craniellae]RAY15672.1 hypothetical protein DPM19_07750 [Actinomadura craniellae]
MVRRRGLTAPELPHRVPSPGPATPLARLLGRAEADVAGRRAHRLVAGRRVLVTGAAGTVGGALCHRIKRLGPAALGLLDRDPDGLARVGHEMTGLLDRDRVVMIESDVRDHAGLDRALGGLRPELVVHTAGLTGTAELERAPARAVTWNLLGTHRLATAAVRHGVEHLVHCSTDKAADPASVCGAVARLGEMVMQTVAGGPTRFASARLGVVLGPPGPLLGTLAGPIVRGETITLAHPDLARHLMTAGEAAGLLLEAGGLAEEAEVFALDMGPPVPVLDLVHRYAGQLGRPDVTIRFTGPRPGEKVVERLFSAGERRVRTAHPAIWGTRPAPLPAGLPRLLDDLYLAADDGDDEHVRRLLRRLLPEYRPARGRPGPAGFPGL